MKSSMLLIKKIVSATIILIVILSTVTIAFSADSDHHYVIGGRGRKLIPLAYTVDKVYSIFGNENVTLRNPQDIYIDDDDFIHILDSGNSRIVVMNYEGEIINEIVPQDKGRLNNPYGIFVDFDGSYLIADTDNARVVHLDKFGNYIEEFRQPDSPLYDTTYQFKPIKVSLDSQGQLYVLNNDDFHGFIKLNAYNEFLGYIASSKVTPGIWDAILERFASNLQQQLIGGRMPPVHTNIYMMPDNTFYATTARTGNEQIKHFTSVGNNIYPKGSFGDVVPDYVTSYFGGTTSENIRFVDICVNDFGIVTALDGASGRIFQYDQDGAMLAVFGGTGNWSGRFRKAVAIDIDSKGRIYVLDNAIGNIQVFKPTKFIQTVHHAISLYSDGKYEEAMNPWLEILEMDRSYYVAHLGMGKVYLKSELWRESMDRYRFIGDKSGYSQAFEGLRKDFVQNNFLPVIFLPALLIAILTFALGKLKKVAVRTQSEGIVTDFRIGLNIIYSPWDGFMFIKKFRDKFSYKTPTAILLVLLLSQIVRAFIEHYPLASMEIQYRNFTQEITVILIPFFTWVISLYLVTSIFEGETKLREIYSATSYSFLPAAMLTIPVSLFSNVLGLGESGIYNAIWILLYGWCAVLVLVNISAMNSYSFKQTVLITLISVFACIFIWCVAGIVYILMNKLFTFIYDVFLQNKLYYFG